MNDGIGVNIVCGGHCEGDDGSRRSRCFGLDRGWNGQDGWSGIDYGYME